MIDHYSSSMRCEGLEGVRSARKTPLCRSFQRRTGGSPGPTAKPLTRARRRGTLSNRKEPKFLRQFVLLAAVCAVTLTLTLSASADAWTGSTAAADLTEITASADGTLERFDLELGQTVTAGQELGATSTTTVYAPLDGTIAAIHAEAGDTVTGTVLEIAPVSRYTVTFTVTGAKQTPENTLVHSGETVYIKCTADGSHRAVGRVTEIDGSTYLVEVLGGELYVGETVRAYRDSAFADEDRVGLGTVTAADTVTVDVTDATLLRFHCAVGDAVERGQRLFVTATAEDVTITSPADGVVTEITAAKGDSVKEDQTLARVAQRVMLTFEALQDDAPLFHTGQTLTYIRGDDPHETPHTCTVTRILQQVQGGSITVEARPEERSLPIGMTVEVRND